jgi:hypothetical protein
MSRLATSWKQQSMKNAILSFAMLPSEELVRLRGALDGYDIAVPAIASHLSQRGTIRKTFEQAEHYAWASYRYDITWDEKLDLKRFTEIAGDPATYLPVFDRYGPYEGGSIATMTRALHDFSRAEQIIAKHRPDIVMFVNQPESGLEYMLYRIALHENIPIMLTRNGAFFHARIAATRYDGPIIGEDGLPAPAIIPLHMAGGEGTLSTASQAEVDKVIHGTRTYKPGYLKYRPNFRKKLRRLRTEGHPFRPEKLKKIADISQSGFVFKRLLKSRYKRYCTPLDPAPVNGVSVFFPLHYQPELTTMPLGGRYVNQIHAVKALSDTLPEGSAIYVKEHTSMFSAGTRANTNFRPKDYYKWLASIPKVQLVGLDVPSRELQEMTDCTACITGTAGFEALLRGRKAIHFGTAAYANAPNSVAFDALAASGVEDFLAHSEPVDRVLDFAVKVEELSYVPDEFERLEDIFAFGMPRLRVETLLKGIGASA